VLVSGPGEVVQNDARVIEAYIGQPAIIDEEDADA
jgi:hypothetical protein